MRTVCAVGLLAIVAAAAAAAQFPTGGVGSDGYGGMRGDFRRGNVPDPVVVDGPPDPARFAELVRLDSIGRVRYDSLYARLMERTQADRDSVNAVRQRARGGAGERDPRVAQALRGVMGRLAGQLQAFDAALREVLTKKQWKRYQNWRDERREEAEQERRERAGGR